MTGDGTVAFFRGGTTLRRDDGDDKYLLRPRNLIQLDQCMTMVAEAAGLRAVLESAANGLVTYGFE
jgi:hypothetical protein